MVIIYKPVIVYDVHNPSATYTHNMPYVDDGTACGHVNSVIVCLGNYKGGTRSTDTYIYNSTDGNTYCARTLHGLIL
jgi:hypothetical protein